MTASIEENMEGLLGIQQALNDGMSVPHLNENYLIFNDIIENENRYWFAKIVEREILSLATFRENPPVKGLSSYSINYSVAKKHRGQGLAVQAVNKGIEELKKLFQRPFYVDAIIDENNLHSIKIAKQIFPGDGFKKLDDISGVPSILFVKLIRV